MFAALAMCMVAGFGVIAGGLLSSFLTDEERPPASPEYAEFFHQNATWPPECDMFMDKEGRTYDEETGVLTYPWLGSKEQETICWSNAPSVLEIVFVADTSDGCPEPAPDVCTANLSGTGVEGFTPNQLLSEMFIDTETLPNPANIAIWSGTADRLNDCQRFAPIGDLYDAMPTALNPGQMRRTFSIALKSANG